MFIIVKIVKMLEFTPSFFLNVICFSNISSECQCDFFLELFDWKFLIYFYYLKQINKMNTIE